MNPIRIGRFTSSQIYLLLTSDRTGKEFGKPALEYIAEVNMERRLQRRLGTDTNSKPTSWGDLVERRVFELLPLQYTLSSAETIVHPDYDFWAGSPDGGKHDEGRTAFDIKCPFTLKSFCEAVDCKDEQEFRLKHSFGYKYYWQLVSNSILLNTTYAEMITYCPYKSELAEIKEMASNYDGDQNKIAWLNWATDDDLPWLPNDGYYKNLNILRWKVGDEDKHLLAEAVIKASKLLI